MYIEQKLMANYLNENGIAEMDEVKVFPCSGKSYRFKLNRTCIDFVSESLVKDVESTCVKTIVAMKGEHFHVQLKKETASTRLKQKTYRYHLNVIKGGAIKLNGSYVFSAIIERGDLCEIGYNRIEFHKKKMDFQQIGIQDSVLDEHHKVIASKLPILLEGETGCGKTSLAKLMHEKSELPGKFIHVNLAAFSKNLIESELFGHIKGAFTGALNDKKGAFEQAQGGTLFIDEIDSLSWDMQTKLLIFLDDGVLRPVGSHQTRKVDTRIIFASGQNLIQLVEQGEMRKDFYFRISCGQKIKLETLRDNPELIIQFCREFELNHNIVISPKLVSFYTTLPWPGNFRQLGGHLKHKHILGNGRKFQFDQVDELLIEQSSHLIDIHDDFLTLDQVKRAYAKKIFYQCDQNYQRAADKLSISPRSLKTLIKNEMAQLEL